MVGDAMATALLVFARYPEPGRAKTRLIPALGAVGAIALYRQLAEATLHQARGLARHHPATITVWFTGAEAPAMAAWLGEDLTYCSQPPGDLGARLGTAFQTALAQGHPQAIALGTDCPWLNTQLLEQACQALGSHDLVLGPATDGGYYLIAMAQYYPPLFQNVPWSTEHVLSQTVAIAQSLGLSIAYLPTLTDIDTPEDLALWQAHDQPAP